MGSAMFESGLKPPERERGDVLAADSRPTCRVRPIGLATQGALSSSSLLLQELPMHWLFVKAQRETNRYKPKGSKTFQLDMVNNLTPSMVYT